MKYIPNFPIPTAYGSQATVQELLEYLVRKIKELEERVKKLETKP